MFDEQTVKTVVEEVLKQINLRGRLQTGATSPVGVSNRHIHLGQEDLDTLFGAGYKLQVMKDLSQPGQFAANETVTVVGNKGLIQNVRILGPVRKSTQIEISLTDSFTLGVAPVVRDSGDTKGTPGCIILGPKGRVILKEGVIVASRHVHLHDKDALKFGLKDGDRISVKSNGPRSAIFQNVLCRVAATFALDFHIDTDEANGAGIKNCDLVEFLI